MKIPSFVPSLALLLAVGCATTRTLHTEASTAAVRSAEEAGAASVPEAALHLQLAREAMEEAAALNADRHPDEGRSMLMRAEADAELAVALSDADADRAEAEAAVARVRQLQAQNPYSPGGAQ